MSYEGVSASWTPHYQKNTENNKERKQNGNKLK